MARSLTVKLVTVTLGAAAFFPSAHAQTAPQPTTPAPRVSSAPPSAVQPATSPVLAPNAEKALPPAAPKRSRAMSPEVAAALAAAAPKYTAPQPKPEPKPEEQLVDMREIDKPKNTIIRLPKVIVQEPRPPVFTERAINTEKGLTDIAMRRYISDVDRALNRFTLPLFGTSAESRALAMYAEDERLRNMSELEATAAAVSQGDAAAGTYIRRETERTFMRSSDFGWNSGPPK
jgi:hypothetical protein